MRYGLRVVDPGISKLGTGKYVTSKFGFTSDDIHELETFPIVAWAKQRVVELKAMNQERLTNQYWEMEKVPKYEIISVEVVLGKVIK